MPHLSLLKVTVRSPPTPWPGHVQKVVDPPAREGFPRLRRIGCGQLFQTRTSIRFLRFASIVYDYCSPELGVKGHR